MTTNEIVEEIMVKSGVDVSSLPDRTLCTQLCAILKKMGGDPDSLPDKLLSTQLGAILECCGGSGGGTGWDGILKSSYPINIGKYFFRYNDALKAIDIHVNQNAEDIQIETDACNGTKSLETIRIINNKNYITFGKDSFHNSSVRSIYALAKTTFFNARSFANCYELEIVQVSGDATVSEHAFDGCKNLKDVSASLNIPSVGKYAFRDCIALEKIKLTGCGSIASGAFEGCTNLKTLIVVDSIDVDVPSIAVDSVLGTGIIDATLTPTGTGFVYVRSSVYEAVIADIVVQFTAALGDATGVEQVARMVFRKIEDYPDICG